MWVSALHVGGKTFKPLTVLGTDASLAAFTVFSGLIGKHLVSETEVLARSVPFDKGGRKGTSSSHRWVF